MNTLLEIKNVTKYFGSGDAVSKALNGVSCTMEKGEFPAIMGASGSGIREQDLAAFRRDRLGFIFQEYNLLDTLTVGENIVLPLNLRKCSVYETSERLKKAAASLEIEDQLSKFPRFRRMMTIEQFRSPELSELYSKRYVNQIHDYHSGLIKCIIFSKSLFFPVILFL